MNVSNDLALWGIPYWGLNQKTFYMRFYSSQADGSNAIMQIVEALFYNKGFVLKASGLPENLNDIMSSIKDMPTGSIHFHEGNATKAFIRQFPSCAFEISAEHIPSIIANCWTNSIYERRRIYVLDRNKVSECIAELACDLHDDYGITEKSWEHIDAMIENVPDDMGDSFVLIFKNQFETDICRILNQFSNCMIEEIK